MFNSNQSTGARPPDDVEGGAGLFRFRTQEKQNVRFVHLRHSTLGCLIRYGDGTPRPPARFTKKLAAWESRNGSGRLVKKEPPRSHTAFVSPASITLHEGDFGDQGVITVTILRTHSVTSTLRFDVAQLPPIGSVRILHDVGDNIELLHLAEDQQAAEDWLSKNPYSKARIETVTADELAAASVEARAA